MLNADGRVWSAICHVGAKSEGSVIRLVGSGESNAFGGRCTTAGYIEVKAVQVDLDLTFKCLLFEFLHVSVQGNKLGS